MTRPRCFTTLVITLGAIAASATFLPAAPVTPSPVNSPLGSIQSPGGLTSPLQIAIILTLLTLGPAILMSLTCFTRVLVVLHFLRQAIGTQNMPNNQILIGLTLFLTIFIMSPVTNKVWTEAISPALDDKISYEDAFNRGSVPLKQFMARYTRQQDIALFIGIAGSPKPANLDEVPMKVMVPAFMISELKTAFQIGFVLYLPFLIIDIVVASILLSTGMMMLPPVVISTPFKILLFVMVDGWNLVVGSLVKSFF